MKIYVHIGLPKTATTTLQKDLFAAGHGELWDYWGVLQPRRRKQREEYDSLMEAVHGASDYKLANKGESTLPVVISEEMLTVDHCGSWQEKLANLRRALTGHDVTILVTVRRPEIAAFSLFAELYRTRRYDEKQLSFARFLDESNQAKIFDYQMLLRHLDDLFGPDAVKVFAFEEIESGKLLSSICSAMNVSERQFSLGCTNARKKMPGRVYTNRLTLKDALSPWLYRDHRKYTLRGAVRYAMRTTRLGSVQIPWTAKKLDKPNFSDYSGRFVEANKWLSTRTSIDYTQTETEQIREN